MTAERNGKEGRHLGVRTAYFVVAMMLLFIVAILPFAVGSVMSDITEQSAPVYEISRSDPTHREVHTYVHVEVIALNEWEGTASLRVSIHQTCDRGCPWGDRFLFVSVFGDKEDAGNRPSSEVVTLDAAARDATQVIKLPVFGDPIRYPFDKFKLGLGLIYDRLYADGTAKTFTPDEIGDYIDFSLQARVPRITMGQPTPVDPATLRREGEDEPFQDVELLRFERPVYLKALTILLVLLVTAAAAYAVFMRPLDQLIINSGALVLGVWGIRSILLGVTVPGLTAVDLALSVVILFLLVTITVRTLWLLEERGDVRLLRRRRRPADESGAPPDVVPEGGVGAGTGPGDHVPEGAVEPAPDGTGLKPPVPNSPRTTRRDQTGSV